MVKWLKPEDFGKFSRARNQLIAELLSKTDLVEKVGSGIGRIKTSMEEAGLPKPIFEYNYSFAIILWDKTSGKDNVPDNVPDKRRMNILTLIKENGKVTILEISSKLNANEKTIKRDIEKLKQEGRIKRIGPQTGGRGYWEVLKR